MGTGRSAFREKPGRVARVDQALRRQDRGGNDAIARRAEGVQPGSRRPARRRVISTRCRSSGAPSSSTRIRVGLCAARHGLPNLGQTAEVEEKTTRAYELRDKVSEVERLYIEARYFTTVARDQPKAIEAYRLLLATYPDDYAAHANLGSLYRDRNLLKEAVTELEEAVRLAALRRTGRANQSRLRLHRTESLRPGTLAIRRGAQAPGRVGQRAQRPVHDRHDDR